MPRDYGKGIFEGMWMGIVLAPLRAVNLRITLSAANIRIVLRAANIRTFCRHYNRNVPRDYGKGIFEGMWMGIVTATTVGERV